FDGELLAKWVGSDELPSESALISEIDGIKRPKKDAAQAAAAAGAAPAARAPSIPSAEVTDRVQSTAGSKNSVDVTLPERRTGGGGTDTSVPPPATTSP
ncbi:MAG: outer membrane protein assembly factor BamE, partial [Ralstonia sp.]|nr:outer membrane protein assembly factor BamE [Ralstonia sp.]